MLAEEESGFLKSSSSRRENPVAIAVSAETGEGVEALLEAIEAKISALHVTLDVELEASEGRTMAWLYEKGQVLDRKDDPDTGAIQITVRLSPEDAERFQNM